MRQSKVNVRTSVTSAALQGLMLVFGLSCGDSDAPATSASPDVAPTDDVSPSDTGKDVPGDPEVGTAPDASVLDVDLGPDRAAAPCETVILTEKNATAVTWRQTAGPRVRAWRDGAGLAVLAPVFAVPTRVEFTANSGPSTDTVAIDISAASDASAGPGFVADCGRFPHGVASGDPTSDGIVLWTRLDATAEEDVAWVVARDPLLEDIVVSGTSSARPEEDYTVRIEVTELAPGATWYYGFVAADGSRSALGRTKTAPVGPVDQLRLATMSCSSLWSGYFNAYRRLAERDLDVVVHLGDFVYDFVDEEEHVRLPPGALPTSPPDRAAWRTRFREYLYDPDLRAARAAHPWIVIWDNHDADEADEAGQETTEVFREYVPMRLPDPAQPRRAWRSFTWGDLADLALLDVLLWRSGDDMLGAEQRAWLADHLESAGPTWRLVGNQKLMSTLSVGASAGPFAEASPWDAFPATRADVFGLFDGAGDVVVLSGDLHFTIAHDLVLDPSQYDPATGAGSVGVELLASGITRGNFDETLCKGECGSDSTALFDAIATELLTANRHAALYELVQHGYGVLDITRDRVAATVWYSPIRALADTETAGPTLEVWRGERQWRRPAASARAAPSR